MRLRSWVSLAPLLPLAAGCGRIGFETGLDMTIDAPLDSDADGIEDPLDNCPNGANADQHDEDGDDLGDICDPCPIDPGNADPDGDGVGGICDPRPASPGDQLVLFETFHAGLPADWTRRGTVTQVGDDIRLASGSADHAFVFPPLDAPANATVMTGFVIEQLIGTSDTDIGVAMPYDRNGDEGIRCELYDDSIVDNNPRELDLYRAISPTSSLDSQGYPWGTDTAYVLTLRRAGTSYTCSASSATSGDATTSRSTSAVPSTQRIALRLYAMTARISYLLVVRQP